MRKILITVFLAWFLSRNVAGAEDIGEEKMKLIGILLNQTDQSLVVLASLLKKNLTEGTIAILASSQLDLEPKAYEIAEEVVEEIVDKELNTNNVIEDYYHIYDKYFTETELKEMIEFNNSPTGMKVIETKQLVAQERRLAAQRYTQSLSSRITHELLRRLRDEGVGFPVN